MYNNNYNKNRMNDWAKCICYPFEANVFILSTAIKTDVMANDLWNRSYAPPFVWVGWYRMEVESHDTQISCWYAPFDLLSSIWHSIISLSDWHQSVYSCLILVWIVPSSPRWPIWALAFQDCLALSTKPPLSIFWLTAEQARMNKSLIQIYLDLLSSSFFYVYRYTLRQNCVLALKCRFLVCVCVCQRAAAPVLHVRCVLWSIALHRWLMNWRNI